MSEFGEGKWRERVYREWMWCVDGVRGFFWIIYWSYNSNRLFLDFFFLFLFWHFCGRFPIQFGDLGFADNQWFNFPLIPFSVLY